jgi:hypothetical protein
VIDGMRLAAPAPHCKEDTLSVNMHAILVGLLSVSHTPEQADHAARSVLEQHAHELAEQQRAHADAMECYNGALYDGGQLHSLPDLIDPKAQGASTEGDTP